MSTACQVKVEGIKVEAFKKYDGFPRHVLPALLQARDRAFDGGINRTQLLGAFISVLTNQYPRGIMMDPCVLTPATAHMTEEYVYVITDDGVVEVWNTFIRTNGLPSLLGSFKRGETWTPNNTNAGMAGHPL